MSATTAPFPFYGTAQRDACKALTVEESSYAAFGTSRSRSGNGSIFWFSLGTYLSYQVLLTAVYILFPKA